MNEDKLKELVNALHALSDEIKDMGVDMGSSNKPTFDTPGCHAGLISIVARYLPELQDAYDKYIIDVGFNPDYYDFDSWANALAIFLGVTCRGNLERWAENNPKLWSNKLGIDMFDSAKAFMNDENKSVNHRDIISHRDIIEHWKQVLNNIENEV